MNLLWLALIVVLLLVLIGAVPVWPHSANFGYAPSSVLAIVIIVVVVLLLLGKI